MGSKVSLRRRGHWFGTWSMLAASLVTCWCLLAGTSAPAQEDKDAAAAAEPAAAPAGTEPAAAEGSGATEQNYLMFLKEALGWKYIIVFLTLSFIFVAMLVMNLLSLRREAIVPTALVEGFEAHLNEKRYQDAYDLAKSDDSFLGHVLSAGLGKLQSGYANAIEAMQEVGEEENLKLEQRLSYIALIGTIAPMFGLLGTVDGMVASFQVIANSPTQPKPADLAKGISMALVTTLIGLWLAIPAIIFFGILRNHMSRLMLEVGVMSEGLMSRFSNVGKK